MTDTSLAVSRAQSVTNTLLKQAEKNLQTARERLTIQRNIVDSIEREVAAAEVEVAAAQVLAVALQEALCSV